MKASDIKKLWRKHGGDQHGPRVETMTIPEDRFYDFILELLEKDKETSE